MRLIGKTVIYNRKTYIVTEWIHFRLDWFEAELKSASGYHRFLLKESDIVVL